MRVIHLIGGGDTGGAKTHVLNLLKELNNHIEADLYCFMRGEFSEEAAKMGIPIHVIESRNPFKGIKKLKELLDGGKVDIIHCHGARGNLMGTMIKRHLKAPVVTTVHSDYRLDYLGRPAAMLSYGTTYMFALRKVNYYIGVSDPMTDILIDRNFPADRIYTIYNGIDFVTPIFPSPKETFFSSIGFHVEPDDVVCGIAARLSPVKDIPTLLKAMAEAVKLQPKLKLIIAGEGEDKEKLLQLTETLGLTSHVCFAGWLNDINSFYHAIDINLLTSISETFPYALTEGTRMKCATIASRVGGVPVLIDHGKNGFIFEPGDVKILSEYLVSLATDQNLREHFGRALYEKSAKLFSIGKMVENQLSIYDSIMIRHQRSQERKRDGIIVCGAYGYGNAGDDAILKSIITSLKSIDPYIPITILAKNTNNVKKTFHEHAIYTFNVFKMILSMRKSILYINGGGSLIQNVTSSRSLYYYLFTLHVAKMCKNKVDMYGCGIGPVEGEANIRRVTRILNKSVDVITLRDSKSLAELQSFGVTKPNISVTSDPALVLKPADVSSADLFFERHGLSSDGNYACFMLRNWFAFDEKTKAIAASAEHLYHHHGITPVFIAMNVLSDGCAAAKIKEHMSVPCVLISEKTEPELLIAVLAKMKLLIAMRLHGLIFASVHGIPLIGISYDPKIDAFLSDIGYGACMGLDSVTANELILQIDNAIANQCKIPEYKKKAELLAEKEKGNIEAVKALLAKY